MRFRPAGRTSRRAAAAGASWFGPLDEGQDDEALSRYDRSSWREPEAADTEFLARQARRITKLGDGSPQRLYRAFVAARVGLGLALLAAEWLSLWIGVRPQAVPVLAVCSLYALATVVVWLLPQTLGGHVAPRRARLLRRQWVATIGIDLSAFAALNLLGGGSALNYAALLVLPALMAGVLTSRLHALGVAAAGALALLISATRSSLAGVEGSAIFTQAALSGAGLFVVAIVAGELSGRLAREERTARGSLALAQQQAQLNRLVLDEMQDGVLVVDRRGRVRAANPAARALLGEPHVSSADTFELPGVAAWRPLVAAVDQAFADNAWPDAGREVVLGTRVGNGASQLQLRVRFTHRGRGNATEEYCVLFIEDLRVVQARARQEKLAAMGRMSAGIAHEIRNPLSAILQANALMAEDAQTDEQRQLTRMVSENAERLKRIVDDVMEVAPGAEPAVTVLDAVAQASAACSEWARTVHLPLGPHGVLQVELPSEPLGVVFDGEHLRRVLVNLLDNALRHSTRTAGAVQVRLAADGARVVLSVRSDGPPIEPEVESHLFEPFFSTRSRGTGLGLYICRELCERYGASIDYRSLPLRAATAGGAAAGRRGNEFSISMRRAPLATSDTGLHFSA